MAAGGGKGVVAVEQHGVHAPGLRTTDKKLKLPDDNLNCGGVRSYREYCSIAKALDVVGDRWTLLLIRELSMRGACRYTDLRDGLPGIATNLLADRLRELHAAGVVARQQAPPPVATTLFTLTPRGAELQPVLDGLMRWGLPLMVEQDPADAVRSHWLAGAVEAMLEAGDAPVTLELRTGDQPIAVEARDGALHAHLGAAHDPDVTLTGEPQPIFGLLLGLSTGGVEVEGDSTALRRIRPRVLSH
jgi:DNA-binding HxlR family transcriptional regulator